MPGQTAGSPLSPASIRAADLAGRIRADLIRGVFGARARLKEGEFAERCGTSRTPVREALRTLFAEISGSRVVPGLLRAHIRESHGYVREAAIRAGRAEP